MKAITVWQPWADLALDGAKKVETRGRHINYRGKIAIHAGIYHRLDHKVYMRIWKHMGHTESDYAGSWLYYLEFGNPSQAFGVVLGTVEIYDCVPICRLYGSEFDTLLERACGDWSEERCGILLRNPKKFVNPIPARGQMGIWNWEETL
jgi:activating signal cointegrator 1